MIHPLTPAQAEEFVRGREPIEVLRDINSEVEMEHSMAALMSLRAVAIALEGSLAFADKRDDFEVVHCDDCPGCRKT